MMHANGFFHYFPCHPKQWCAVCKSIPANHCPLASAIGFSWQNLSLWITAQAANPQETKLLSHLSHPHLRVHQLQLRGCSTWGQLPRHPIGPFTTWRFPKMAVPPNHPKSDHVSIATGFGDPPFWEAPHGYLSPVTLVHLPGHGVLSRGPGSSNSRCTLQDILWVGMLKIGGRGWLLLIAGDGATIASCLVFLHGEKSGVMQPPAPLTNVHW